MTENSKEEALVTHGGKWYTVYAPAQGPKGFTTGWLADETGTIINVFSGKYSCTDDLVTDVVKYLDRRRALNK